MTLQRNVTNQNDILQKFVHDSVELHWAEAFLLSLKAPSLSVTKFTTIIAMRLATLCSDAQV
jgi:hypothetical protein